MPPPRELVRPLPARAGTLLKQDARSGAERAAPGVRAKALLAVAVGATGTVAARAADHRPAVSVAARRER